MNSRVNRRRARQDSRTKNRQNHPQNREHDDPADLDRQIRVANRQLLIANLRLSAERLRHTLGRPARKMTPAERKAERLPPEAQD